MLVEETTVPEAALPVAQFKEHLRLGTGFSDDGLQDGLIAGFLRAAIATIEARTGKALLARQFGLRLKDWAGPEGQPLPVAPVSVVVGVWRVEASGAETALEPALWRLEPDALRPCLRPRGWHFPVLPTGGGLRIAFVAGFGADWADVPADLAQAVLMLAAHYYEYRTETALAAGCMPFGVTALIERYRPLRIGGAGA